MSDIPLTIPLITSAMADLLGAVFPEDLGSIYNNPRQGQGNLPAWYINYIPQSGPVKDMNTRYWRNFGIDLVYINDYNLPDLYDEYAAKAELLDQFAELFNYFYTDSAGERKSVILRTYDRNWTIDLQALHYKFNLKIRANLDLDDAPFMQEIYELHEHVIEPEEWRIPDGEEN